MKLTFLPVLLYGLFSAPVSAFDQTHKGWDTIVSTYVDGDSFNYRGLKPHSDNVGAYLKSMAEVREPEFEGWSVDEQLAYLINLYNAATIDLILKNYPVKSIKEINSGKPWELKTTSLFGKMISLDQLENEVIRGQYEEPRIHFAVNCASVGCPSLREDAYVASKLDVQLEEQTKKFMGDEKHNRIEGDTLVLSPIFDWYGSDFKKSGDSIIGFIGKYLPASKGKGITFGEYDWSLNEAR